MTSTPSITRVAVVQMDCAIGDAIANTDRVLEHLDVAVHRSAQIVIFPEAALTGYCFDTVEEAREPSLAARQQYERIVKATKAAGVVSVVGSLEYEDARLWNSVWIAGPDGLIGAYRKTHLP
ncbi:MAG: carbon-nitrogen hydrolase family protein, partial [Armatimonadetes bacterium]|nr:carbon-nitrogen hydrolase family protein [Armatimonadota bacterium]